MNAMTHIPSPNIETALQFTSLRNNVVGAWRFSGNYWAKSTWAPKIGRFINKYLYRIGFGAALNRYDSSFTIYSSWRDSRLYQGFDPDAKFLNFGSGSFFHKRWTNFDYPAQSRYYGAIQGKPGQDFHPIDLCADNLKLPYGDNTVSLIYCSHTLEHLETPRALHFLRECARVLGPNGVLRLALPNTQADLAHARIVSSQSAIDAGAKAACVDSAAWHILSSTKGTDSAQLAALFRDVGYDSQRFFDEAQSRFGAAISFDPAQPERHISHWTHDNLRALVEPCGFAAYLPLYRGASTQAPFKNLEVFDTTEPHIAFYGEFVGAETVG
ncbi:MAG: methyltransferase domain-containing protein [Neomegalonema sp.]|nr:methyltransferase domain-containing protein [Neomegalonema sp.]